MGGKELLRAKRFLQRKKYTSVIRILEPQVFRFRQNPDFYYLLGTAYLHTGDISGASTYLQRVLDLKKEHIPTLLQLATIYLRQRKNQDAIETWLNVLELDSGNKYAKRALDFLKQTSNNSQLFEDVISTSKINVFLPKKISHIPFVISGIIIVVFLIPALIFIFRENTLPFFKDNFRNKEVQELLVSPNETLIDLEGDFIYILTEKEVENLLEDTKKYFNRFEDNSVQIIVNRIKNSNASRTIKDKVLLIEKYLKKPDFTNFTGNISYHDIMKDPLLYENCYIRWKGKTSNLLILTNMIRFDFLIGYHDNKILEGIVQVTFDFAISIEQGDPVELIGKLEYKEKTVTVHGSSIRPLAPGS